MKFNIGESTNIWLQFFIPVMQFEQWLMIVMNLEAKQLDIPFSAHMVDLMPCTCLA